MKTTLFRWMIAAALGGCCGQMAAQEGAPVIERRLPPVGLEIPAEIRGPLEARVTAFLDNVWAEGNDPLVADAAIFGKAVRWALIHREIYDAKQWPLLEEMLAMGEERLKQVENEEYPWAKQRGLLVRGYESRVDGSYQPYGLEIPAHLDLSKPVPLLVWLHGRGDKTTDLHFIRGCLGKSQALGGMVAEQQDAIIVHPFGRHCVGWKHAGETDVFEVIEHVSSQYPIDPDRIALAGFSMGGAGAWHIGARFPDRFCAVHAGAGFAETARYNKLTPDRYPSPVEQTLWKVYDTPGYVRNLFNVPVLAYSGEKDKQKQAADLMAEAIAAEGGQLRHVIGLEMEHKYHPDAVAEIWAWLKECWAKGRDRAPAKVEVQTPTARHGRVHWVESVALERQWEDSRVQAQRDGESRSIAVTSRNVASLRLHGPDGADLAGWKLNLDGQTLTVAAPGFPVDSVSLRREGGKWTWGEPEGLTKGAGLQGPIDDAFLDRFVVVGPESPSAEPRVRQWVEGELDHFRQRWRALMRGDLPEKNADEVNAIDVAEGNLILWGDPTTNPLIAEMADRLPVRWEDGKIRLGSQEWAAADHVPAFIFPNPLNPERYVVINSGLTFREGHDGTNSLQNPKLGDWVVIGLDEAPNELTPGRVAANGFFDERWQVKP
ncbi:MAG: prolyl oligopeptidase family serine peptidase [Verrucomicrobiales bacterium]|nr:prolyl oligopeptidase family serine peptidase [Verrucomicrobiales bacterium]